MSTWKWTNFCVDHLCACAACHKSSATARCAKCAIAYCNVDCQAAHWPVHKSVCKSALQQLVDVLVERPFIRFHAQTSIFIGAVNAVSRKPEAIVCVPSELLEATWSVISSKTFPTAERTMLEPSAPESDTKEVTDSMVSENADKGRGCTEKSASPRIVTDDISLNLLGAMGHLPTSRVLSPPSEIMGFTDVRRALLRYSCKFPGLEDARTEVDTKLDCTPDIANAIYNTGCEVIHILPFILHTNGLDGRMRADAMNDANQLFAQLVWFQSVSRLMTLLDAEPARRVVWFTFTTASSRPTLAYASVQHISRHAPSLKMPSTPPVRAKSETPSVQQSTGEGGRNRFLYLVTLYASQCDDTKESADTTESAETKEDKEAKTGTSVKTMSKIRPTTVLSATNTPSDAYRNLSALAPHSCHHLAVLSFGTNGGTALLQRYAAHYTLDGPGGWCDWDNDLQMCEPLPKPTRPNWTRKLQSRPRFRGILNRTLATAMWATFDLLATSDDPTVRIKAYADLTGIVHDTQSIGNKPFHIHVLRYALD
jgi:hypothetical protein